MKKSILSFNTTMSRLCLLVALIAATVSARAAAGDEITVDDMTYTVNDDGTTVTLTSATSVTGVVTVPSEVTSDGTTYKVTAIGDSAFFKNKSVTSVTVSEGVTSIGVWAFYYASAMTSITLPSTVTTIGSCAFYQCTALTSFEFPSSITTIGTQVFRACSALTSIEWPAALETIPDSTFYNAASLATVTLPSTITTIGKSAFNKCVSLTSIELPEKLETIGKYVFYYCSLLTEIKIPDGVTFIPSYAFQVCKGLTKIYLPKKLEYVDKSAFYCAFSKDVDIYSYTEEPPGQKDETGVVFYKSCSSVYATLHVPDGSADTYTQSTSYWAGSYFKNTQEDIELEEEEEELAYDLVPTSVEGAYFSSDSLDKYIEAGDIPDSLTTITLTFDEAVYVSSSASGTIADLVGDSESVTLSQEEVGSKEVTVSIPTIAFDGSLTITIAEGSIGNAAAYAADFESGSVNSAITLYAYYEKSNTVSGANVTVSPEEGEVDSLSTITVTFTDYDFAWPTQNKVNLYYVLNADGDTVTTGWAKDLYYNYFVVTLNDVITAAGTYTLVLPAGTIYLQKSGDAQVTYGAELNFTYTITAPELTNDITIVTTDPLYDGLDGAVTISELSTIAIKFSDNVYINPNETGNEYYDKWVNILNTDRELVATGTLSQETEGDSVVIVTLDSVFTNYAQYRMYLLAGAVGDATAKKWNFEGGSVNQSYNAIWFTVGSYDAGEYTLSPASGSTVESLTSFTLTYTEQSAIELSFLDGAYPTLTDADGNVIYTWTLSDDQEVTDNSLTLTLPDAYVVSDPGTYTLTLPDSLLVFGGMWAVYGYSPEITATYTIEGELTTDLEIKSIDPAGALSQDYYNDNYSKISEVSEITLTFDEPVYVNPSVTQLMFTDGINSWYGTPAKSESNDSAVVITLPGTYNTAGCIYTLVLTEATVGNADAYKWDFAYGKVNASEYIYFVIEEETAYETGTVSIVPEEGVVGSLSQFTLTFEDYADSYVIYNDYVTATPYVTDADGNTVATGTVGDDTYTNVSTVTLNATVSDAGEYTFVVPANTYYLGGYTWTNSEDLTFSYTIEESVDTGISSISADSDDDDTPTYNIAGQRVNATTKGILIRRGKKIVNK